MDRLEDVRMNETEALAQEAIREPESVWVQRPERRNCGKFGVSSTMEGMNQQAWELTCMRCATYERVSNSD
jgi:hypothetical protein